MSEKGGAGLGGGAGQGGGGWKERVKSSDDLVVLPQGWPLTGTEGPACQALRSPFAVACKLSARVRICKSAHMCGYMVDMSHHGGIAVAVE